MNILVDGPNKPSSRSSSRGNIAENEQEAAAASTDAESFSSLSKQSNLKKQLQQQQQRVTLKSKQRNETEHSSHKQFQEPKQRKSKQFNIPKTLIVTDSNAVVIDNIDLNSTADQPANNVSAVINTGTEMPNQINLLMSPSMSEGIGDRSKKRSDSKSSSLRDNNSVIFPSSVEMSFGIDMMKLAPENNNNCCCCFCILLKKLFSCSLGSKSSLSVHSSVHQTRSVKKSRSCTSMFVLFIVELKKYLIGFLVSLAVCASLVLMNYLIRRTFNMTKLSRLNSSLPSKYVIETDETKFNMDCEFCYAMIWLATSLLTLVYPAYLLVLFIVYKIKRPQKPFNVRSIFFASLNVFKNPPLNNYKKIPQDTVKSDGNQTTAEKGQATRLYMKRNYYLKIGGITLLWLMSGYLYLRAIDLLYCIDVIILFSIDYSFIYMIKWIILHQKFIPLRVGLL